MSSETTNWEAIARYLAGESSAEELAVVRQWMTEHPADAKVLGALDVALARATSGSATVAGIDVEGALVAVKARRNQPELRPVRGGAVHSPAIPARRGINAWLPIAAAAVVIAVGSLVWRTSSPPVQPEAGTVPARTLSTPAGRRDSLVLPDGSQVVLGPGSELTMAAGFGQAERRVHLTGVALFTVVHDDAKPFIVVAKGVVIRDIGTAFVVRGGEAGVRVAVTEGVVELTAPGRAPTTLNAGDAAAVRPGGEVTTQRGIGADDDLAWTTGKLVFRDTPLSEVAENLGRWYGVRLDIPDATLRRRPYTGSFQGDSLRHVLDVISLATGASIERRGDTVVLRRLNR